MGTDTDDTDLPRLVRSHYHDNLHKSFWEMITIHVVRHGTILTHDSGMLGHWLSDMARQYIAV